jgi:uncharacterized membrane protein YdbT with pleckstrin-like domain
MVMTIQYALRLGTGEVFRAIGSPVPAALLTIEVILLQIVNLYFLLTVILSWINEYYILNPKEVIIKTGVFTSQSVTYEFANLQSMTVNQSVWQKIFNFGTIRLFNPVLKEEIYLSNIPDPVKFGNIIQQHQPDITPIIRKTK